jgi:hypothetical protein
VARRGARSRARRRPLGGAKNMTEKSEPDDVLRAAKASGVPEIYTNGSALGLGSSDIVVVLERNNDPVAIVNMSFTSAKSLVVALGSMIAQIEERSHRPIMTSGEIDGFFSEEDSADDNVSNTH